MALVRPAAAVVNKVRCQRTVFSQAVRLPALGASAGNGSQAPSRRVAPDGQWIGRGEAPDKLATRHQHTVLPGRSPSGGKQRGGRLNRDWRAPRRRAAGRNERLPSPSGFLECIGQHSGVVGTLAEMRFSEAPTAFKLGLAGIPGAVQRRSFSNSEG